MPFFQYGTRETDHLTAADPRLGAWIAEAGFIQRQVTPDPFEALISSVISQQISGRAAETIWERFAELVGSIVPKAVLGVSTDDLRACGLSGRKVEYIQGIATAALNGEIDLTALPTMSDEEVVHHATKLRGVGVWTAEMLLIFCLQRPNVLSYNDLGIRRGLMRLHHLEELSPSVFANFRQLYAPYASTASLYLWKLATAAER